MNPDIALFHLLNDFVGTLPPVDWIARALVNDYAVPTAMALVAAGLWFAGASEHERLRNQRAVLLIALGLLFANALIKDLSLVYFRPRPFATEEVKLLFYRPSVSSFPSVPATVAFCGSTQNSGVSLMVPRVLQELASESFQNCDTRRHDQ